jgi:hypothetical protein
VSEQDASARRRALAGWFAFALLATGWLFAARSTLMPNAFGYDFVAFFCGASVAASGADPYRVEPLRACEHQNGRQFRPGSKLVVPAPLPGYAFALLEPLARIPYPIALVLWTALLLAAYAVCAAMLVRFTALPPPVVVAATALSVGYASIFLGQLVPISLAALALAARELERERWYAVAAWCGLAAIEPQLALPAIAALFVARKAARLPLTVLVGALVLLSLATLGFASNVEYATAVVHAQVASEIARSDQLSPLALAYRLGLAATTAATLGNLLYIVAAALGVAFALVVERRTGSRAALLFIPPAIALLGMPYVHAHHLAAAVPAALLLVRTQWRTPATIAAFGLAIPWIVPYDQTPIVPFAALAIATLGAALLRLSPLRAAALGCGTFVGLLAAQSLRNVPVPPPPSAYASVAPNDLAQAGWNVLIGTSFHGDAGLLTVLAIPAWAALVALTFAAVRATTSRRAIA